MPLYRVRCSGAGEYRTIIANNLEHLYKKLNDDKTYYGKDYGLIDELKPVDMKIFENYGKINRIVKILENFKGTSLSVQAQHILDELERIKNNMENYTLFHFVHTPPELLMSIEGDGSIVVTNKEKLLELKNQSIEKLCGTTYTFDVCDIYHILFGKIIELEEEINKLKNK